MEESAAKKAYIQGYQDSQRNKPYDENPYSNDPLLAACWAVGWIRGGKEDNGIPTNDRRDISAD